MSSSALNETPNFAVRFEQLMSRHPKISDHYNGPCLRDLIFDHYLDFLSGDDKLADEATKKHIEALWETLGR